MRDQIIEGYDNDVGSWNPISNNPDSLFLFKIASINNSSNSKIQIILFL